MRILYIVFENPAVYTILEGMHDEDLWGLPALYYPFKMLTERGHTVDMLLFSDREFDVVPSPHFKKSNLIQIRLKRKGILGKLELPYRLVKNIRLLLKKRHYDFVYGMGEGAYPGIAAAYSMGVPAALRQYGTQEMANVLETIPGMVRRYIRSFRDYPYITLSMHGRMSFLLATNDGSRADELYDILGVRKKKFPFYFWRSGVYIPKEMPELLFTEEDQYPKAYSPLHISHIGRIADVKRQDRSVRILGELHRRGYPIHLHLVGYPSGEAMLEAVKRAARECHVEEYVHVEGNLPQTACREHGRNSLVTLLVGEWNRVNIFYEVMGEGAVVLTNDNHSIDEFIEDGVNCLVYEEDNYAQAAEKIIGLMKDPEKMKAIRAAAYRTATEKFMSLEKRFGLEVRLVEDAAGGRSLDEYPSVL